MLISNRVYLYREKFKMVPLSGLLYALHEHLQTREASRKKITRDVLFLLPSVHHKNICSVSIRIALEEQALQRLYEGVK